VFLILYFMISSAFAQAQPLGHAPVSRCAATLEQKLKQLESTTAHAGEETLDPTVQRWLEFKARSLAERARTENRRMQKKAGDVLLVGGQTVRVLAPLGSGVEAEVYLVQTVHGRRTAKVFYDERKMKVNLKAAQHDAEGIAMPQIESVDHSTHTVLMEYIEGIPVIDVLEDSDQIGMSKKDADAILRRFLHEKNAMTPPGRKPPLASNVVYSPKTSRFYVIDPF